MFQGAAGRVGIFLLAGFAALAVIISPLQATPAHANLASDFTPGNIISDDNLYNGSAMTSKQVQSFLDKRSLVGPIVDPLRDFTMTTKTQPGDKYCKQYSGARGETAADIIQKVGKACNISQKAILVILQKEQGLITDGDPTTSNYTKAMGYSCPDTAPCDAKHAGFFAQVYGGARTYQVYKANPNWYNYKPFKTNTIQWHPDKARCGTSQVYIENRATAGLYIYTPYRPNQAALNAERGTGNSCSTYGNRNFFVNYKAWFGDPRGVNYVGREL